RCRRAAVARAQVAVLDRSKEATETIRLLESYRDQRTSHRRTAQRAVDHPHVLSLSGSVAGTGGDESVQRDRARRSTSLRRTGGGRATGRNCGAGITESDQCLGQQRERKRYLGTAASDAARRRRDLHGKTS